MSMLPLRVISSLRIVELASQEHTMSPTGKKSYKKMCKHCNPSKPHTIRENKGKHIRAKQPKSGVLLEKVKAYQKEKGGYFEKDDWLCPKFQAKLIGYCRKRVEDRKSRRMVCEDKEIVVNSPSVIVTRSKKPALLHCLVDPVRKVTGQRETIGGGDGDMTSDGGTDKSLLELEQCTIWVTRTNQLINSKVVEI